MFTKCLLSALVATAMAISVMPSTNSLTLMTGGIIEAPMCNNATFHKCQGALVHAVTNSTITSVRDFLKAIYTFEKDHGGADGFDLYCSLHTTYETCMGPSNLAACMDPQYLIHSQGYPPKDAYELIEVNAGYNFKCMPKNEKVIHDTYDCIDKTRLSQGAAIQKCQTALDSGLQNSFNHTVICNTSQTFSNCINTIYEGQCPKSGEIVCGIAAAELKAVFYYCDLKCMAN